MTEMCCFYLDAVSSEKSKTWTWPHKALWKMTSEAEMSLCHVHVESNITYILSFKAAFLP